MPIYGEGGIADIRQALVQSIEYAKPDHDLALDQRGGWKTDAAAPVVPDVNPTCLALVITQKFGCADTQIKDVLRHGQRVARFGVLFYARVCRSSLSATHRRFFGPWPTGIV